MALKFGVTDARKLAPQLDPEYDEWKAEVKILKAALKKAKGEEAVEVARKIGDLEDLMVGAEDHALTALEGAMEIISAKAKFTVVGQVKSKDNSGDKVALGMYGTEKQATDDAYRLTYSTQTHEEGYAWVLPIFDGTPANWYSARKGERNALAASEGSFRERELARRVQWVEDHPDQPLPEDWGVFVPFTSETTDCPMCDGLGRVAND